MTGAIVGLPGADLVARGVLDLAARVRQLLAALGRRVRSSHTLRLVG